MKTINIIKPIFFSVVTLAIFYLIFKKVDYLSLKEVFSNIRFIYLFFSIAIILLTLILAAKKWQVVLRAMDYSISLKDSFNIIMASIPVSAITPAKAGDLIRAHYLKDRVPVAKAMGAIVTERLIDIIVLALYSFIGAAFLKNGLILGISLSIIFLIPLFFLIGNRIKLPSGRWQQIIENFLHASKIFVQRPRKLLPVLFYALILWSLSVLIAKFLFLALGVSISLFYIAAAFPIAIFMGLLPITIAGMGTRDSAIIYFFSSFAGAPVCLGVGLLYSLFAYWFLALLGLPMMKKLL